MEILNIILLVSINLLIIKFLLGRGYKNLLYALIPTILFIVLNLVFGELPRKLIPITLFFSFSLLVFSAMSSFIDVTKNNKAKLSEEVKERFRKVMHYLINFVMPVCITIYQILLMLNREIQNKI